MPRFIKIVVELKASVTPLVLKVWLGLSNGIFPAK